MAERTQKDVMQEDDIASWLEEGNVSGRSDDPSTRQFKLEDNPRPVEDEEDDGDTTIMITTETDETMSDSDSKKKKKKKEFGKLPPRTANNADSSVDAANDAIKRYFNRG